MKIQIDSKGPIISKTIFVFLTYSKKQVSFYSKYLWLVCKHVQSKHGNRSHKILILIRNNLALDYVTKYEVTKFNHRAIYE